MTALRIGVTTMLTITVPRITGMKARKYASNSACVARDGVVPDIPGMPNSGIRGSIRIAYNRAGAQRNPGFRRTLKA